MNHGQEYGYKEDYAGYADYDNQLIGKGQPKPSVKYSVVKSKRAVQ